MTIKVINKVLATEQDLDIGLGKVSQTRGGTVYSLDKLSISKVLDTVAAFGNALTDAASVDPNKYSLVYVKGYTAADDGGEGVFYWDASANIGDEDFGTAFTSAVIPTTGLWRRVGAENGEVNVKWFGAKGDDVADDTVAIDRAVSYCNSESMTSLLIPGGTYRVTNTLNFGGSAAVNVRGEGTQISKIKFVGNVSPGIIFDTGNEVHVAGQKAFLRDLTLITDNLTSTGVEIVSNMALNDVVRAGLIENIMFVGSSSSVGWHYCIRSADARGITVQHCFALGPSGGSAGNAFWFIDNTLAIGTDFYTYFDCEANNYAEETKGVVPSGGNIQSIIADGSITLAKLAPDAREQIGVIKDFAGIEVPTKHLECDGASVSRTTYSSLYGFLTQTYSNTSRTNGSPIITGFTSTTEIGVGMPLSGNGIPAGAVVLSVDSSVQITMSQNSTATSTSDIVVAPWGVGDGVTTFNLPDLTRYVTAGRGGTGTATLANVIGQTGGLESFVMTDAELEHQHNSVWAPRSGDQATTPRVDSSSSTWPWGQPTSGDNYTYDIHDASSGLAGSGTSKGAITSGIFSDPISSNNDSISARTEHMNIQPTAIVMKIIKY